MSRMHLEKLACIVGAEHMNEVSIVYHASSALKMAEINRDDLLEMQG